MQSNVNSDTPTYLSSCPCESHLAKTYAERTFRIPVDQLFDLTFGDNAFSRAYHDSQKLIGRFLLISKSLRLLILSSRLYNRFMD